MLGSLAARGKAQSIPGPVVIATLVVVSLLYLTMTMQRSIIVYDEGLILFGAERVLHGDIPHRDFFANYGPAQFYLLAGLYKLFGASVLIERVLDTLERCVCVALVFVIVDLAAPRMHAILAAAASLIWLQYFAGYGYPLFPALAAALAGLAILIAAHRRTPSASRLVAAGGCAGIVVLFRYDVGVVTFAAECTLLALTPAPQGERPHQASQPQAQPRAPAEWFHRIATLHHIRTVVPHLLMFSLGFAVITVPFAVAMACYGAVPDLVFDIVTSARNYARMRSMPFPRPAALWANPAEFGVYLPIILCAAAVPTIIALVRYRQPVDCATSNVAPATNGSLLWTLLVLVAMTLLFYSKGLVHVSTLFVSMGLITSLALAGVLAQPLRERGRVDRAIVATAVAIGCAATLYNVPVALHQAWWNIEWAVDSGSWQLSASGLPPEQGSCRMPPGLERIACFKIRPEMAETVRYIQQRTAPDDPVFIGLAGHDKILGNDILIYFLLDRPSATKWHHFDPGLQTSAPIQELMIDELRHTRPKLIMLEKWGELTDPNESSVSSGVFLLDDYIRQTYYPVATFGPNTIMRARTP